MNKYIIMAAVGIGSAAAGAAAGYIYAREKFYAELDSIVEEKVSSTKEFYQNLVENSQGEILSESLSDDGEDAPDTEENLARVVNIQRIEYNKILTSEGYSPAEETPPDDQRDEIEMIGEDDFNDNESDYDQGWLKYYADGVFTDSTDSIVIADIHDLIGTDDPHFGDMSVTSNLAHFRNHVREVDYEVERMDVQWSDVSDEI